MQPTLQLVSDRGATSTEGGSESRRTRLQRVRRGGRRRGRAFGGALRALAAEERGPRPAAYASVIMAAGAFAGLLVAIMRSSEIRAMLVELVENALGAGS